MNPYLRPILAAVAALSFPASASADQKPASACTAPVAPTGELAPWSQRTPLNAARSQRYLSIAALPVGKAVDATLLPTPDVTYPLKPEKPGGTASYGGLIGLDIKQAGTYRVALSAGAWIDVVRSGKVVTSTSHGHGPECSGVRKIVDFPLEPGRYTLQLAASSARDISVLVARLP